MTYKQASAMALLQCLKEAHLERYYHNFTSTGITQWDHLSGVSMDDYSKFGIRSMEDRLKLFRLIQVIRLVQEEKQRESKSEVSVINHSKQIVHQKVSQVQDMKLPVQKEPALSPRVQDGKKAKPANGIKGDSSPKFDCKKTLTFSDTEDEENSFHVIQSRKVREKQEKSRKEGHIEKANEDNKTESFSAGKVCYSKRHVPTKLLSGRKMDAQNIHEEPTKDEGLRLSSLIENRPMLKPKRYTEKQPENSAKPGTVTFDSTNQGQVVKPVQVIPASIGPGIIEKAVSVVKGTTDPPQFKSSSSILKKTQEPTVIIHESKKTESAQFVLPDNSIPISSLSRGPRIPKASHNTNSALTIEAVPQHAYFPKFSTSNEEISREVKTVETVVHNDGYNYGLPRSKSTGSLCSKHFYSGDKRIKVCARKRPLIRKEQKDKDCDIVKVECPDRVIIREEKTSVGLTKQVQQQLFLFDEVFPETTDNETVYRKTVKPMLLGIFTGRQATCFCFGQTGSGKTHTLIGNKSIPGLCQLAAGDMFQVIQSAVYGEGLQLWISCYEIYKSQLHDLLNNRKRLHVRDNARQQVCIAGLMETQATNMALFQKIINHAQAARSIGSTGVNPNSSRSHAILQFDIRDQKDQRLGRLSFIDLAGSERAADVTDFNRQTRMEGAEINQSLLALKECIRSLDQESSHTPYRQSKLTRILKDSFTGNSVTCMIANIAPTQSACQSTLNTLRYADRVKAIGQSSSVPNLKIPSGEEGSSSSDSHQMPLTSGNLLVVRQTSRSTQNLTKPESLQEQSRTSISNPTLHQDTNSNPDSGLSETNLYKSQGNQAVVNHQRAMNAQGHFNGNSSMDSGKGSATPPSSGRAVSSAYGSEHTVSSNGSKFSPQGPSLFHPSIIQCSSTPMSSPNRGGTAKWSDEKSPRMLTDSMQNGYESPIIRGHRIRKMQRRKPTGAEGKENKAGGPVKAKYGIKMSKEPPSPTKDSPRFVIHGNESKRLRISPKSNSEGSLVSVGSDDKNANDGAKSSPYVTKITVSDQCLNISNKFNMHVTKVQVPKLEPALSHSQASSSSSSLSLASRHNSREEQSDGSGSQSSQKLRQVPVRRLEGTNHKKGSQVRMSWPASVQMQSAAVKKELVFPAADHIPRKVDGNTNFFIQDPARAPVGRSDLRRSDGGPKTMTRSSSAESLQGYDNVADLIGASWPNVSQISAANGHFSHKESSSSVTSNESSVSKKSNNGKVKEHVQLDKTDEMYLKMAMNSNMSPSVITSDSERQQALKRHNEIMSQVDQILNRAMQSLKKTSPPMGQSPKASPGGTSSEALKVTSPGVRQRLFSGSEHSDSKGCSVHSSNNSKSGPHNTTSESLDNLACTLPDVTETQHPGKDQDGKNYQEDKLSDSLLNMKLQKPIPSSHAVSGSLALSGSETVTASQGVTTALSQQNLPELPAGPPAQMLGGSLDSLYSSGKPTAFQPYKPCQKHKTDNKPSTQPLAETDSTNSSQKNLISEPKQILDSQSSSSGVVSMTTASSASGTNGVIVSEIRDSAMSRLSDLSGELSKLSGMLENISAASTNSLLNAQPDQIAWIDSPLTKASSLPGSQFVSSCTIAAESSSQTEADHKSVATVSAVQSSGQSKCTVKHVAATRVGETVTYKNSPVKTEKLGMLNPGVLFSPIQPYPTTPRDSVPIITPSIITKTVVQPKCGPVAKTIVPDTKAVQAVTTSAVKKETLQKPVSDSEGILKQVTVSHATQATASTVTQAPVNKAVQGPVYVRAQPAVKHEDSTTRDTAVSRARTLLVTSHEEQLAEMTSLCKQEMQLLMGFKAGHQTFDDYVNNLAQILTTKSRCVGTLQSQIKEYNAFPHTAS